MQQPSQSQMFNSPKDVTTEQIQKYLEENAQLIMAILEHRNKGLGESAECISYQDQLQQNLTHLAMIADTQPPQVSIMPSQMPRQSSAREENHVMPSQVAALMSQQQQGFLASKFPFLLNDQHQQQPQMSNGKQQQLLQGQMGMRPDANSGIYQAGQTGSGNNFMNARKFNQDSS